MKIIIIQNYKDFGLLATERGIDGYLTNDGEALSGIVSLWTNYTGGRYVIDNGSAGTVKMGPFLDDTDGKTVEDSLTITQSDVLLSKNDGNFAQKNDTNSATHDENGWYDVTLNATDTDTQGNLLVYIHVTGALPVWRMFEVTNPSS